MRRAEVKGHRHGFRGSSVLLIEAADNPRPVHKLCHQTQHPKQDHHLESPRARPEFLPALPFGASQQVVQKTGRKITAPLCALECFCTVVGSSSSSSCFSQQKHRKPCNAARPANKTLEPPTSWSRTSLDQTKSVELTAFTCAFPRLIWATWATRYRWPQFRMFTLADLSGASRLPAKD